LYLHRLVNFARKHGIITSCFSPFAGQKADGATLIHDPTVKKLAEKNNMGVGQLLQSWAVQRGTVPLGKSGNAGKRSSFESIMAAMSDNHDRANQSEFLGSKATGRGQGSARSAGTAQRFWKINRLHGRLGRKVVAEVTSSHHKCYPLPMDGLFLHHPLYFSVAMLVRLLNPRPRNLYHMLSIQSENTGGLLTWEAYLGANCQAMSL
jgi:hypothetical protein